IMSVGFGCSAGLVEVCFATLPIGSLEVVYAVAGYAVEVQSHDGVGEHVSLFFGEVVGAGDDLREGAFTALADGVPDLAVRAVSFDAAVGQAPVRRERCEVE